MSNAIIITYDISDNKTRTRFSKFLEKYGVRIQFSVYEVSNSKRVLDIVTANIEKKFKPMFDSGDSIFIFKTDKSKSIKYGSAQLVDSELIFL